MLIKWVTIHQSYGLPRAAYECRKHLENHGVRVQLSVVSRGSVYVYMIRVPQAQKEKAIEILEKFKQGLL